MPVVEQLPVALGPGSPGERVDVGRDLLGHANLRVAEEAEASVENLVGARDQRSGLGRNPRLELGRSLGREKASGDAPWLGRKQCRRARLPARPPHGWEDVERHRVDTVAERPSSPLGDLPRRHRLKSPDVPTQLFAHGLTLTVQT